MKNIFNLVIILSVLGIIISGCIESPEPETISILVQGSPIDGANGIIFDSKD